MNDSSENKGKFMAASEVDRMLALVPQLLKIPHKRIWVTYDEEADVLYINFKKPSHADYSELTDDDIIIRYEKGEIVGLTVLHASKRKAGKFKFDWEGGMSELKEKFS
jgi:uncharacterized protein YuzE